MSSQKSEKASRCLAKVFRAAKFHKLTTRALNKGIRTLKQKNFPKKPCFLDNFFRKLDRKIFLATARSHEHSGDVDGY